jgi:acyl-CoA reductase-like NAD-dependent aldehyde dehydrogenase
MNAGHLNRIYVDGEWVLPAGQERASVIDPSTEEPVAQIALGNAQDVARPVDAARRAFASWSVSSPESRAALLGRVHSLILERNNPTWDGHAPFGGYKRSGNGREYGREGFEEYLETKAILGFGQEQHA